MKEIIHDISRLEVGRRYVVKTDEPHGEFHVGEFMGWRISIAPDLSDVEPEFISELPEDWEERYPTCVFERAEVDDYYMFVGWEE